MEKTIKAGKKSYKLTNKVKWMQVYKNEFGRDIMPMLIPVANAFLEIAVSVMKATGGKSLDMSKAGEVMKDIDIADIQSSMYSLAGLEFTDLLAITWSMARTLDDETVDFDTWVDEFVDDFFPVDEIAPTIIEINAKALMSSKNYSRLRKAVESLKPMTRSTLTES
jgi:hypothetical protein